MRNRNFKLALYSKIVKESRARWNTYNGIVFPNGDPLKPINPIELECPGRIGENLNIGFSRHYQGRDISVGVAYCFEKRRNTAHFAFEFIKGKGIPEAKLLELIAVSKFEDFFE